MLVVVFWLLRRVHLVPLHRLSTGACDTRTPAGSGIKGERVPNPRSP